jgi:hypothetical protein
MKPIKAFELPSHEGNQESPNKKKAFSDFPSFLPRLIFLVVKEISLFFIRVYPCSSVENFFGTKHQGGVQ